MLKARAFERLGKIDEALAICDEVFLPSPYFILLHNRYAQVKKKVPCDAYTLKVLHTIYHSVGKSTRSRITLITFLLLAPETEASDCYVQAWNANPENEDCAKQVFMAYIREDNFAKQQQFCGKMFKQTGNINFYFGSMQCNMLHVEGDAPNKLVDLVEKQLEKCLADGKISHYEILMMFLNVLRRQRKYHFSPSFCTSSVFENKGLREHWRYLTAA